MKCLLVLIAPILFSSTSFAGPEAVNGNGPGSPGPNVSMSDSGEKQIEADTKRAATSASYPAFIKLFHECDSGLHCTPYQVRTFFDTGEHSCIKTGRALNWWKIKCGEKGKEQIFDAHSKPFETIAVCMKARNIHKDSLVLYREGKPGPQGFNDFAYFSIGCLRNNVITRKRDQRNA